MANINDDGFLELSGIHQHSFQEQLSAVNFPILEGVSPLSLRILNQASRVLNVTKGVEMMLAGDTPHDLYFIAKGSIAVAKAYNDEEQVVARLKAGDFYGEYGVLRGKTRFASVYTAETSVIVRVDLNAVQQVIDGDEAFKTRLFKTMNQRILNSFLFSHAAFRGFSAESRNILSEKLAVTVLERDETLFEQGDKSDKYFIILSGEAEIFFNTNNKDVLLEIRRDNGILGEVRTDNHSKYGYTARAANQLDLLQLDKASMQVIQQVEPNAMKDLNKVVSEQVKKTILTIQKLEV